MKRRLLTSIIVLALALLSMGAAKQQTEQQRMSIFISNFTEAGLYDFDLEEDGDDDIIHLGDPERVSELIRFGITHNIINNPKSTIKKCTDKKCSYGKQIISGQSVAASVKKYFDMNIKNQSVKDYDPAIHYDGKNYHINADEWKPETVYYADVQEVEKGKRVIHMSGELYNLHDKSDRPATFTATAKPYTWNEKSTWAILSLVVEWK